MLEQEFKITYEDISIAKPIGQTISELPFAELSVLRALYSFLVVMIPCTEARYYNYRVNVIDRIIKERELLALDEDVTKWLDKEAEQLSNSENVLNLTVNDRYMIYCVNDYLHSCSGTEAEKYFTERKKQINRLIAEIN